MTLTSEGLHLASAGYFGLLAPAYVVAAARREGPLGKISNVGMLLGAAVLTVTIYLRGVEVDHAPFQTLYEVYLLLALCLAVSHLLINLSGGLDILRSAGTLLVHLFGLLTCVAIVVVLVMGLNAGDFQTDLPPALQSAWFVPHVIVYIFGYGSLALAMLSAAIYLVGGKLGKLDKGGLKILDRFTHRIIALGFPFLTAGLIFGSLWAYEAWANYWAWDSKEVWSLITWFAYLIYLHLRRVRGWRGRPAAWTVVAGGAAIFITLLLFGYLPASITSVHNYGP